MRKTILSEDDVKYIIDMYINDLMGSEAIYIKTGVNKRTILRTLKENNIPLRNSGRQFTGGRNVADKKWRDNHKKYCSEKYKIWSQDKREHLREYHTKWREENKEHLRKTRNSYERNRKHNDPMYKLTANFRTAIYTVLKENNVKKCGHYFEILGYTPEDLKQHLDGLLTDGMTWENYGEWHVDHKIPITSFNFTSVYDEEFKKCWSLENLQPMWGPDNIKKSNKLL